MGPRRERQRQGRQKRPQDTQADRHGRPANRRQRQETQITTIEQAPKNRGLFHPPPSELKHIKKSAT